MLEKILCDYILVGYIKVINFVFLVCCDLGYG